MTVEMNPESVDRFFAFARERHAVYLRRRSGAPAPWTQDAILSRYRITNVYRELDKTTRWFRENVRDPLRDGPNVLLATVLFRWFNTIRSGETIFSQPDLLSGRTPWEQYLEENDPSVLVSALRKQGAPWVTGAYMIRSPEGMDKLDGVVQSVHEFATGSNPCRGLSGWNWRQVADLYLENRLTEPLSMQDMWHWLKQFYGLGPFLAYEIVTDLRHTALLDRAPDILTWANPGPGALRGAGLILRGAERGRKGRLVKSTYPEAHAVMTRLLELSRDVRYWPQFNEPVDGPGHFYNVDAHGAYVQETGAPWRLGDLSDVLMNSRPEDWPSWEMREPEMWLCEFAKYERTRLGFGRPRGTFP